MQVQRYLLGDKTLGAYFGDYTEDHTSDFQWFLGERMIGLQGLASTEAESFVEGILVRPDSLIIALTETPSIRRRSDSYGVIRSTSRTTAPVEALINLICSTETTNLYLSSKHTSGAHPKILTFSSCLPPSELYAAGTVMPVTFDDLAVQQEQELQQTLAALKANANRICAELGIVPKE